ncbi:MAG: hypothetical protein IPG96_05335 [Proteobacteria bacterium]|nr:hypothetical protein [Pseudomonadota bacterium]
MHEDTHGRGRQLEVFRRMTAVQRLNAAARLYWSARELKEAALRAAHQGWTEEQIQQAVKDALLFHRG